jgi:transposase-like protein
MPKGRTHHRGEKAYAARLYGQGVSLGDICKEFEIQPQTLWTWRRDPEFQRIANETIEQAVAQAAQGLRRLAPQVIDAFERGLASRTKAVKGSEDQVVELPDLSLMLLTADKVSQRIPELVPHKGVDVDVDPSNRLVELLHRLDERDGAAGGDDGGRPLPPPPGPEALLGDEPVDHHEAGAEPAGGAVGPSPEPGPDDLRREGGPPEG